MSVDGHGEMKSENRRRGESVALSTDARATQVPKSCDDSRRLMGASGSKVSN